MVRVLCVGSVMLSPVGSTDDSSWISCGLDVCTRSPKSCTLTRNKMPAAQCEAIQQQLCVGDFCVHTGLLLCVSQGCHALLDAGQGPDALFISVDVPPPTNSEVLLLTCWSPRQVSSIQIGVGQCSCPTYGTSPGQRHMWDIAHAQTAAGGVPAEVCQYLHEPDAA